MSRRDTEAIRVIVNHKTGESADFRWTPSNTRSAINVQREGAYAGKPRGKLERFARRIGIK